MKNIKIRPRPARSPSSSVAVDACGSVVADDLGEVHFSDPVGGSTLPVDHTFTAADSGIPSARACPGGF
jgi:hypothetical protein